MDTAGQRGSGGGGKSRYGRAAKTEFIRVFGIAGELEYRRSRPWGLVRYIRFGLGVENERADARRDG